MAKVLWQASRAAGRRSPCPSLPIGSRLNLLERKAVVWKAEVLEEVKRLRAKSVKAR
jgi:hypothetical protein